MNLIEIEIPVSVSSLSCVGIGGEYPFAHGNYFCTSDESGCYAVHNVCYENFDHLVRAGVLTGKVKALVVETSPMRFACHIIDERIPESLRQLDYLYNGCDKIKAALLKAVFRPVSPNCVCDYTQDAIYWFMSYKDIRKGRCICCDKQFTRTVKESGNE